MGSCCCCCYCYGDWDMGGGVKWGGLGKSCIGDVYLGFGGGSHPLQKNLLLDPGGGVIGIYFSCPSGFRETEWLEM